MTIIETDSNGSMEEMVMKIGEVKGKTVVLAITDQKEAIILNATTVAKIGTAVRTTIEINVTDLHHILLSAVLFFLYLNYLKSYEIKECNHIISLKSWYDPLSLSLSSRVSLG